MWGIKHRFKNETSRLVSKIAKKQNNLLASIKHMEQYNVAHMSSNAIEMNSEQCLVSFARQFRMFGLSFSELISDESMSK